MGSSEVDASLLWVALPFGLLSPSDEIAVRTADRVSNELVGPAGGVHRYADDSYYGGGAWVLLTASLAETLLAQGKVDRAEAHCRWIEEQIDGDRNLPEQVPLDLPHPEMYPHWIDAWGPIATPLLWSHAGYLRLVHSLNSLEQYDLAAS